MKKRNVGQPLSKQVEADQEFILADDYEEEYKEAKVTLAEEEKVVFDITPPESNKMLVAIEPYYRKKQFKKLNKEDVFESTPTAFQPGLLVRRFTGKREDSNED